MTSPPPLLGPDLCGELLGERYRLDKLIGWGGMASVYAAVDLRLGRSVAAKVVVVDARRVAKEHRDELERKNGIVLPPCKMPTSESGSSSE